MMAVLDVSVSSTLCTNEELITLDPVRGREAIRHGLDGLSDGAIVLFIAMR